MLLERAALPIGRVIYMNAVGASDTFGVLGPFPGFGLLRSLTIGYAAQVNGLFRVGACMTASNEATLVNWQSAAALIDVGAVPLAGKPMIELPFGNTGESTFFTLEFWRAFETGSQYVIVAVSNEVTFNARFSFNALWEPIVRRGGAERART